MYVTILRMLLSSFVAGSLAGISVYQATHDRNASVTAAIMLALKDVQAYLSTPPQEKPKSERLKPFPATIPKGE
jgi:hypothetical protein